MSQYNTRQSSPLRSLENSVKNDSAKLRAKIATRRRSILIQSELKIKKLEESEGILAEGSGAPRKDRNQTSMERIRDTAESPQLQSIRNSSRRSISRKKERKEAAEMKLKGLFSRSLSFSQSEDSDVSNKRFASSMSPPPTFPSIKISSSSTSTSTSTSPPPTFPNVEMSSSPTSLSSSTTPTNPDIFKNLSGEKSQISIGNITNDSKSLSLRYQKIYSVSDINSDMLNTPIRYEQHSFYSSPILIASLLLHIGTIKTTFFKAFADSGIR